MQATAQRSDRTDRQRSLHTLVLNADYRPLSTWPLSVVPARDAVQAVYRDRVAIVENWDAVFRSPSTEIARVARGHGYRTLREDGLLKARRGETSIEEVLRVTGLSS